MSLRKYLAVLFLLAGLVLAACAPSAKDAAAPSSKENELRKDLADAVRQQLAAEAALAALKAEDVEKLAANAKQIAELQAKVADFQDKLDASAKPAEDTRYVVVRKITTPGALIQSDPKNHPNDYARVPSVFEIVFKGVQSGREYPPLAVQEAAFTNFHEGDTCTREDVARAKP